MGQGRVGLELGLGECWGESERKDLRVAPKIWRAVQGVKKRVYGNVGSSLVCRDSVYHLHPARQCVLVWSGESIASRRCSATQGGFNVMIQNDSEIGD